VNEDENSNRRTDGRSIPLVDWLRQPRISARDKNKMVWASCFLDYNPERQTSHRRIGHLKEGYEANFLVLSSNPLKDFGAVKKIKMREKGDKVLK
jgi:hypothetical protein